MDELDKQRLVANVKRAWAGVPYPGDENIVTSDSCDDEGTTEYFSGTTWNGHAPADLRAHSAAISTYFTPPAYCYWMPAYLIAAVEDPEELGQGVDSIVDSLTPEEEGSPFRQEQRERVESLTHEQRRAVISILEYLFWKENPWWTREEKLALKYLYEITELA